MKPIVEKHSVQMDQDCIDFLSFYLRILEYGTVTTNTTNEYGEKFVHLFRLNYIVSGNPYYNYRGQKIELEPGCLVFLSPNEKLGVEEGSEIKLYFANFELGAVNKYNEFTHFTNTLFPFSHVHDDNEILKRIFEAIILVGSEAKRGFGLEIQNLFENLFLQIIRKSTKYHPHTKNTNVKGTSQLFNMAIRYINTNLDNRLQINQMADALHISENYLYKIFIDETGVSPIAFIQRYRIDLAKRYLENTTMSIKEIAMHTGFNSNAHFSTVFKKNVGQTPANYRKNVIKASTQAEILKLHNDLIK